MSNQSVIIKSNRYGLIVILDEESDWEKIKKDVAEKFSASAKFFGNAQMAICFRGRKLEASEEEELVQLIEANCQIQVTCLVDEDETTETKMREAVEQAEGKSEHVEEHELANLQDGRFYKGTLRSGQVLESETSIIILGDVNPGARVVSKGNIIVLGALKGNVFVGAAGNEAAFVAALSMEPMQIRIGDVIARSSDGKTPHRKKADDTPKIAFAEDGNIYIEPITKEVLNDIKL